VPRVKEKASAPPRERILQAARELFYRDGINAVSVDAVAAAAGTNKMTLYRQFTSKDALVAEYLSELAARADEVWETARAGHPGDAQAQLRAVLKRVSQFADECTGRGCALANVAVELGERNHPARRIIEAHKRKSRERLVKLCREAGYVQPERLADELFLLVEGARVSLQSAGKQGPGSRLFAVAEQLLRSTPRRRQRTLL